MKYFYSFFIHLFFLSTIYINAENRINLDLNTKQGSDISVNYIFTTLSLSNIWAYGSILSWRDINMNGAQVNINIPYAPFDFERSYISISYSGSYNGYWTDDDANNNLNQISVRRVNSSLLNIYYELWNTKDSINTILGFVINCLWFENFGGKTFFSWGDFIPYPSRVSSKYNVYRLGLYSGFNINIVNKQYFNIKLTGSLGITGYLAFADWVLRSDFKHPVSFFDFGIALRTNSKLEFVFTLGIVNFFSRVQLQYEICPLGLVVIRKADDSFNIQNTFTDFSQSSISIGLMVRF